MLKKCWHIIKLISVPVIALLCMAMTGCAPTDSDEPEEQTEMSATNESDLISIQPLNSNSDRFRRHLKGLSVDSVFNLGTGYIIKEPVYPDSAMMCLMTIVSGHSEDIKDKETMHTVAEAYVNMAYMWSNIYSNLGNAFVYLRKAENICKTYGFDEVLSYVYLNLGVIFSKEDNFNGRESDSIEGTVNTAYLRKAFEIAAKRGDTKMMSYCIYNMTVSDDIPVNDSVTAYMHRYLAHTAQAGNPPETAYFRALCHGILSIGEGNTQVAHEEFLKAQNYSIDIEPLIPRMREYIGELNAIAYETEGAEDKAEQLLLSLVRAAGERDDLESVMAIQKHLTLLYSRTGRHEEADRCQLGYYRTRDVLMARNSEASLEQLRLKENLDDFQTRLDQAQQHERKMRSLIMTGGVAGIAVILILILTLIYSRRRRRYITALYEHHINSKPTTEPVTPVTPTLSPTDTETEIEDNALSPTENSSAGTTETPSPELMERIDAILSESQEVFNPDFQMTTLCAMVGSNITYVSRAVNTRYGRPFKLVLAERRIREACRRFDIPADNATLTIEAICHEVGFRSRTAFSAAFKNITGLTPTEYRKAATRHHLKDN